MMYQWRKFEFFEEKLSGKCVIPEEVKGKIVCSSSGRGKVVLGGDNGVASLLDRGLKFNYGFQAHSVSVLFLQQLKQRNFLVTVGEDEQLSPQQSALCLKVFNLDRIQDEGSSTSTPDCIGILHIFTNQFPEAKITSFLIFEEAPPILLMAIGLDNGCIYCIKGDIVLERITRFKLQVDNALDRNQSSITGLGFKVDGPMLHLFAVTPASISLFNLKSQPPSRQTLDQIGCNVNSITMSDRSELIVGLSEAVYFYEVDGRGPSWAFEGEKKFVGWFRGYLLCVIEDQRSGRNSFNVYDLKNRLIAHSLVVKEVSQMLCEWGNIFLILADKSVLCIGEKDMESKLDMLFKKNLYTVAINLVQSQQADAAATAEVLRKYGDHLFSKQDYDEAMAQYINTIGHLEPSYVIQKFLDAQRLYNLAYYLENLHEKGLASKDHTTLLLNCYTKLKDVQKLNVFIKSEDGVGEHKFDVETAIRVCRAANYHEHAMYVAKKAGKHELYLKILLEDLGRHDEALQYIRSLETSQAGATVKEYGKILIEHKPQETVDILMRLCTEDGDFATSGASNGSHLTILPSPVDFLNMFIHRPQALMTFLERYTDKIKDSPAQVEINNTLLELYLSNDLNFSSVSQAGKDVDRNFRAGPELNGKSREVVNDDQMANQEEAAYDKSAPDELEQGKIPDDGSCITQSDQGKDTDKSKGRDADKSAPLDMKHEKIPDDGGHIPNSDQGNDEDKDTPNELKEEKIPDDGCSISHTDQEICAEKLPVSDAKREIVPDDGPTDILEQTSGAENTPVHSEKVPEDGFNWRKYGQKNVRANEFVRSYYRCTYPFCQVKRQVERSHDGKITDTVYLGQHSHPPINSPAAVNPPVSPTSKKSDKSPVINVKEKASELKIPAYPPVSNVPRSDTARLPHKDEEEHVVLQMDKIPDDDTFNGSPPALKKKRGPHNANPPGGDTPSSEARTVIHTVSEVDIVDDGHRWRKYGQKMVKSNTNPRSYYRCSWVGCPARKLVERASQDQKVVITTYEGQHLHGTDGSASSTRGNRMMPDHYEPKLFSCNH